MTKYLCTHCGKHFEAEEKELLECPGCFWSTSVKKEEDAAEKKAPKVSSASSEPKPSKRPSFKFTFPNPKLWLKPLVIVGMVALALWLGVGLLTRMKKGAEEREEKKAQEIRIDEGVADEATLNPLERLTDVEKANLHRRVEITSDRTLSDEEKKILENRVAIQTGFIQKLPSQAFTLEDFKGLISSQEKQYKISLPGSYKRKLNKVFEQNYLPGTEAFLAGNLLAARNHWVSSLAFPIYADNIQKHRGVILTMLRPFINDTLSKVGAINSALVEQRIRNQEQRVNESYQGLISAIDAKDWVKAQVFVQQLRQEVEGFDHPETLAGQPDPYPESVGQVDDGIRFTLFELLNKPPVSVADFTLLRQDLSAKEKVIVTFIPENLKSIQNQYESALVQIQSQNWDEAVKLLESIQAPPELRKDAQDKLTVLEKLRTR